MLQVGVQRIEIERMVGGKTVTTAIFLPAIYGCSDEVVEKVNVDSQQAGKNRKYVHEAGPYRCTAISEMFIYKAGIGVYQRLPTDSR
jgi:hypothetical protein